MKKTKQLSLIITFLSLSFIGNIGHAQDSALIKCMKTYLDLKVSPDMALSECRKISMIDRQIFQSFFIEIKIAYAKSFVPFRRAVYFAQHQQHQHIGPSEYYLE